jgi:hypothetical protein
MLHCRSTRTQLSVRPSANSGRRAQAMSMLQCKMMAWNPAERTYTDQIGYTLRPNACSWFLRPLTDRRYVRMGI